MAVADAHGHRYEISPEGILSIMPPAGVDHAVIASRLLAWFLMNGWLPEQVLQNCGLRIVAADGTGGRVPDLTVWWRPPKAGGVWAPTEGLALAIEIVSKGSEAIDHVIKRAEYGEAEIPVYWIVNRDAANTVAMWRLEEGVYREAQTQPLAWLLNTSPDQHLR
jgi:Uma2 family endonuclease